jgi:hypothetical protein
MAEVLDGFPKGNRKGKRNDPKWNQWLDGRVWKLVRGVDFSCAPQSFRANAHSRAECRGLKIRGVIDGDIIVIQAYTAAAQ